MIASFSKALVAVASVAMLSACDLPRPGPNFEEVTAPEAQTSEGVNLVLISQSVAKASRQSISPGFHASFLNASSPATDIIRPGDKLTITVWENVDNGLLATLGQKVTTLADIEVDQSGRIFVPYAGRIEAAGRSPEQLRQQITRQLNDQTPDPQVEVRRLAGDGATINLIGDVGGQGVYAITPSTRKLTSMIASAGGITADPQLSKVTVRRGKQSGAVYASDLYRNPDMDIALRPGDTIVVDEDEPSFMVLGATTTQALVPFPKADLTLLEALAEAGGLDSRTADPKGIFVFRRESGAVADRVLNTSGARAGMAFAYILDLTQPGGFFMADEFQVRDGDTIYITEAEFVGWARVIEATASTLNFGTTLVNAADVLNGN